MNARLKVFLEERNYTYPHLKKTSKILWDLVLTPQSERDELVDKLCALMRADPNFALSVANRCRQLGEPLNGTNPPKKLSDIFDRIDPFKLVAKVAPNNDVSQVMAANLEAYYIRVSKLAADNAAALAKAHPDDEVLALYFALQPVLPLLSLAQLDPDVAAVVLQADDVELQCQKHYGFSLTELTDAMVGEYAMPSMMDPREPTTLRANAVFRGETLRTKTRRSMVRKTLVS
ncbi:MAG: hypothetical protein ACKO15_01020 [Burkholderiales bacterium]